MKTTKNELQTRESYDTPNVQVTDIINEQNVRHGGSAGDFDSEELDDLQGEIW